MRSVKNGVTAPLAKIDIVQTEKQKRCDATQRPFPTSVFVPSSGRATGCESALEAKHTADKEIFYL